MNLNRKPDMLFAQRSMKDKMTELFGHLCDEPRYSFADIARKAFNTAVKEVQRNEREPLSIMVILSHSENYWEIAAARGMIASLRRAYSDEYCFDFTMVSVENQPYKVECIMRGQLFEDRGYHYDACVVFSPWIVEHLRNIMVPRGETLPIIFGGVATPDRLGFCDDLLSSKEGITGAVMEVPRYDTQVQTILEVKPHLKNLIVPFDTTLTHSGLLEPYYGPTQSLLRSWREHGRKIIRVGIEAHDDIAQKIVAAADSDSLINLSVCSSVIAQTDTIIQACNDRYLPIYAHNRQAVRQGALFGSGLSGEPYGPALAELVAKVCIEHISFEDIPMTLIRESVDVCYSERGLKEQQFRGIDDIALRKMRMLPIEKIAE